MRGVIFLPAGVVLLIGAAMAAGSTLDFLRHSRLAAGLVVAEPYGPHHVTIRFRTAAGRGVAYHQSGAVTLHAGEAVVVRYDRRDPARDPRVDRFGAIWGTVVFLGVLGSVFAGVGASLLRRVPPAGRGS